MHYSGIVKVKGFPEPKWYEFSCSNRTGLASGALTVLKNMLGSETETVLEFHYRDLVNLFETRELDGREIKLERHGWKKSTVLTRSDLEDILDKNTPEDFGFVLIGPNGTIISGIYLEISVYKNKKGQVSLGFPKMVSRVEEAEQPKNKKEETLGKLKQKIY